MKETGQLLKEHREERGLTVNEVASALKLNAKTITAIEEGDTDSLPPKTFLRGFVRSYAKFLKLDTEEILSAFLSEMGSTKPKLAIRDQRNEEDRQKALEDSMSEETAPLFKKIMWFFIGIVAMVLIIFVFRQVKKYEKESTVAPVSQDIKAIADNQPTNENDNHQKTSDTPPKDTTSAKPLKAPAETENQASTQKTSKPETTQAEETKKEPEVKKEEKIATTLPSKKTEESSSPQKEVTKTTDTKKNTKSNELIIEAFDKITVTYKLGNGESKTFNLKGDDVRIIKADGEINLKVSDGGALNLVHNGKDLGVPGSLGSSIELKF